MADSYLCPHCHDTRLVTETTYQRPGGVEVIYYCARCSHCWMAFRPREGVEVKDG